MCDQSCDVRVRWIFNIHGSGGALGVGSRPWRQHVIPRELRTSLRTRWRREPHNGARLWRSSVRGPSTAVLLPERENWN